jgi:hypothetical protein
MVSVHFGAMSSWSHLCLFVSILCYQPREYHLQSCQWSILYGSSYPMGDVIVDIGTWESFFQFWASDRVGPRRLSNEAQHKQSHEAQPDFTRCYVTHSQKEKLLERPRSFPPSNCPDIFLSPWSMHPSLVFVLATSLRKSRDDISFKGVGL